MFLRDNILALQLQLMLLDQLWHLVRYVDDVYIASRDPGFLQKAIGGLVTTFERVGLETNTKKTHAMTCTPGTI